MSNIIILSSSGLAFVPFEIHVTLHKYCREIESHITQKYTIHKKIGQGVLTFLTEQNLFYSFERHMERFGNQ